MADEFDHVEDLARSFLIPGRYHSGMRIHPETGEIFTMIPEEEQTLRGNLCELAQHGVQRDGFAARQLS